MTIKPSFSGEVQLAGWSESHNSGCKVTFWLADSADLDAFRAMTVRKGNTAGQRLACVLVEIGDDERPVTQTEEQPRDEAKDRAREAWRNLGPHCREAVNLCGMPEFQEYVAERGFKASAAGAAGFVKSMCNIESRNDLDADPVAYAAFRAHVAQPFQRWAKERATA